MNLLELRMYKYRRKKKSIEIRFYSNKIEIGLGLGHDISFVLSVFLWYD